MLGLGVVGLGRIGRLHAEISFTKISDAKLVAVSDVVESLVKKVGEKFHVKAYTSYDDLLKDKEVDAVIISTPTYLHKEMILKALEAGKHVFTEKPLCLNTEEAKEIEKKVRKSGLKLQVGYMRRFDYAFINAKKTIERGEIGEPLTFITIARDPSPPPAWESDPKLSGGIFLDMLSHDFDMARWLMESEITEVYVKGGSYLFKEVGEKGDLDVVTVSFEFENGGLGLIHGTRKNVFGYDLRVEVYGSNGTIFIGASYDNMFSMGFEKGILMKGHQWFMKRFYDAYVNELQQFVKSIINDTEPPVNVVDGRKVVEISEACWKSLRERKPVRVS